MAEAANHTLGAIWGSVSSFIGVHVSSYLDTLFDIKSWQQVSWPHWFSVTYNKMYSQFPGKGLIPTPSFFPTLQIWQIFSGQQLQIMLLYLPL